MPTSNDVHLEVLLDIKGCTARTEANVAALVDRVVLTEAEISKLQKHRVDHDKKHAWMAGVAAAAGATITLLIPVLSPYFRNLF